MPTDQGTGPYLTSYTDVGIISPEFTVGVSAETFGKTAGESFTWEVGTGDSVSVSNFVFVDSSTNYYATGYGGTINLVAISESPSIFRKLKWKLRDISHSIRRLILRLEQYHHERQRIKAEAKAQILLDDLFVLVPGQKFIVVPSLIHKDREYRIPLDGSMPEVWVNGKLDHRLCIQKSYKHKEYIPRTDLVITRALMAQGAEDEFLRIANKMNASIFTGPDLVINQDSDM